ncbi:MAG: 16S rRNA (guanine(966)-N(2))-methyltransferase RsmD, partial [Candidatus Saccharimonas sp.]
MTSIRVISGKYGGRKIDAPAESNTRTKPMGERIRNAMFNSIGSEIQDTEVLDAFAGTGAVGFEALSRGASHATFIERDKDAQGLIFHNMQILDTGSAAELVRASVESWIDRSRSREYDIIFADPPYGDMQLSTVSKLMGLLKPNGLMVLSHTGRGEVPNLENGIVVVDNRSYGNA